MTRSNWTINIQSSQGIVTCNNCEEPSNESYFNDRDYKLVKDTKTRTAYISPRDEKIRNSPGAWRSGLLTKDNGGWTIA